MIRETFMIVRDVLRDIKQSNMKTVALDIGLTKKPEDEHYYFENCQWKCLRSNAAWHYYIPRGGGADSPQLAWEAAQAHRRQYHSVRAHIYRWFLP